MKTGLFLILFLAPSLWATNYTVKIGGGGSFTSITACMTQMSTNGTGVADTCTVFAGTYNETPTVPAGSAGNYKTVNVNGSDVVSVFGFVLNSHTQLIGNCPEKQGTVTTATCGFFISHTASPTSAACVSIASSATDIYIKDNVMYACGAGPSAGMIQGSGVSFVYIQGNTWSYSGVTTAQAGTAVKEGNGAEFSSSSNHILEENNDASHYTLNFCCGDQTNFIIRNNNCHDQYETEAGGNAHTDCWYWSPNVTTQAIVVEGNFQYTGVGPNAKGILNQGEFSPCNGACGGVLIYRFNTVKSIGSGNTSSYGWNHFVMYNNTYYDIGNLCSGCFGGGDNFFTDTFPMKHWADLNSIWYFPTAQTSSGIANPVAADSGSVANGFNTGFNLAYCNASGASNCSLFGHVYESGTWTGDTGNILGYIGHSPTNDPLFVSNGTNFHLQATSPAIAAGTNLTTANGNGTSSTSLVVNDASYFQDSYGLTNANSTVSPDCISVTTVGNHVCITAVNYSTNTLTLASAISWSTGDKVWLYSKSDGVQVLFGAAPDLGAFPNSNAAAPTCTPGTGSYTATQTPACTNTNSGTTVQCYTTNGTTPATNGLGTACTTGTLLTSGGTVSITTTATTLKIIAGTSLLPDSSVNSYLYTLQGGAPTAAPGGGTYTSTQTVTLTSPQSQSMAYTTDGSTPTSNGSGTITNGTAYTVPLTVSSPGETIKAIGFATGFLDSAVGTFAYTINSVTTGQSGTISGGAVLSGGAVIH